MKPNQDTFKHLHARGIAIQDAIASSQASRPEYIKAGDLFIMKMPIPAPVTWCAVFSHSKDSDLWYCTPGDSFSLLANVDVAAAEIENMLPLNFRVRCGLWIHVEDIDLSNRIGQVAEGTLIALRDKVSLLASDPISLLRGDELAGDPDYEEWIDDLHLAVDSLREFLHDEPSDSVRLVDRRSELALTQQQLSLAAADSDGDLELPKLLRVLQIFDSPDGLLKACLYDDGVVLEWHPTEEDASKPAIVSQETNLPWRSQDGFFCTGLIPWISGTADLSVNDERIQIAKD